MLPLDEEAQAAVILRGYRAVRHDFGLNRIKLGAHLHLIKEHKLWKGLAETWEEFLATENINPNAARQYVSVAKKFVYELDLDDQILMKLGMAGISALEKAGRVINESNKDEMIAALTSLSERDAIQRIIEISSGVESTNPQLPTFTVLKILKEYHGLPPDLQMDFRSRLGAHEDARKKRHNKPLVAEQEPCADAMKAPSASPTRPTVRAVRFRAPSSASSSRSTVKQTTENA